MNFQAAAENSWRARYRRDVEWQFVSNIDSCDRKKLLGRRQSTTVAVTEGCARTRVCVCVCVCVCARARRSRFGLR